MLEEKKLNVLFLQTIKIVCDSFYFKEVRFIYLFIYLFIFRLTDLVAPSGVRPLPPHWKHGILTTGPPGKS